MSDKCKIDWKKKLGSRKFWMAVAGFVAALLVLLGKDTTTVEQVTAIIVQGGVIVAYLLAEGKVDAEREKSPEIIHINTEEVEK